jgi:hypothetical protein
VLGRIWDQLVELRSDIRMLAKLVEVFLDRVVESESLSTREACEYAQCSEWLLKSWRKDGLLRGEKGRWNRRDLQVIVRAYVLKEVGRLQTRLDAKDRVGVA